MRTLLVILVCLVAGGCGVSPSMNPSFPTSFDDARIGWDALENDRKPYPRPVLVLGGIYDPGLAPSSQARRLRSCTTDASQVIAVGYPGFSTFDRCAQKAVDALERKFPSDSETETVEVDVIGYSMGGIVARFAAMPNDVGRKRLNVRRMFTISSPHRGARLAVLPVFFDSRVAGMRKDSELLHKLDEDFAKRTYEFECYTLLGDFTVGAKNTSPPGINPHWLPNAPISLGHFSAGFDRRIMLDIALRLRGETPITQDQTTPVP